MKLIGAALIIISSFVTSYYYDKSLKNKIKICEELKAFIIYIRAEIEYYTNPINVIFEKYSEKNEVISLLIEGKNEKFLSNEFDAKILDFFNSIGKGYKKEQLAMCDYSITLIDDSLNKLKSEYPSKTRVFRSIILFFGICAIILLI